MQIFKTKIILLKPLTNEKLIDFSKIHVDIFVSFKVLLFSVPVHRDYQVKQTAPWTEIAGPQSGMRLRQISIQPCTKSIYSCGHIELWAVTEDGFLVCRQQVSKASPYGVRWTHVETSQPVKSVSVAQNGNDVCGFHYVSGK